MSARTDPALLALPGLVVDPGGRTTRGIRISLPRGAGPARPHKRVPRKGAFWAGPPELARPAYDRLCTLDYVVVDVETTGGSFGRGHRITEVCAVRIRGDGTHAGEFASLINPQRPIPPAIMSLTRITHETVAAAPVFDAIAQPLADFIEDAVFVAHNALFDWHFVTSELARAGVTVPHLRVLDTVRLARRLVPEISRRSLDALSWFFDVENEARHRAFGDARATARIFGRLLERMEEREVDTWQDLETLMQRRAPRRRRSAMPQPVMDP